jgi:TatD DNase family protein
MLIDSHAHLSASEFDADREQVLERAKAAGIEKIINICTTSEELEKGLQLSSSYPWVFHAAATPPHTIEEEAEKEFEFFVRRAHQKKLVAIGETGLDYHYAKDKAALQQAWLARYLALAEELSLPLIIHCRDAFADLLALLKLHPSVKGIIHCFTGTLSDAWECVALGWFVSFSGILTFKKSEELRQIAKELPLKHILIETDAPYLAPHPYRSKRNEPAYLIETARTLATLKHLSLEDLSAALRDNVQRAFTTLCDHGVV